MLPCGGMIGSIKMNNFEPEYRQEIIQHVNEHFIDPRNALHGGRTEVFKTFYETKAPGEFIFGFDISSLTLSPGWLHRQFLDWHVAVHPPM